MMPKNKNETKTIKQLQTKKKYEKNIFCFYLS